MSIDKAKLFSLFDNIKKEHRDNLGKVMFKQRTQNSDVLIIDGTNNFCRNFCVVPTLNDNGDHVGGVSGFLSSIGYSIKLLSPTRVIVVFDGKGGSLRRKKIYPEYKAGRKSPKRLNRTYEGMVDDGGEAKALSNQMSVLAEYLTTLPVSVIAIDYIEADDVIAYLANHVFTKPEEKITIMSSDKDFYQLVSDRINVFSPIKKKVYGVQDIVNEYQIHPHNFIYYRILEGDTSDNIDGIDGIGLKTTIKRFPMLLDSEKTSVEKLLLYATDKINESKIYAKVSEGTDKLELNHKLMQLAEPDFAGSLQANIIDAVSKKYSLNKFEFLQLLTRYGMHQSISNYNVWLQEVFQPLTIFKS